MAYVPDVLPACLRRANVEETEDYGDDPTEGNLFYDDGDVWCLCTLDDADTVVLHDFRTKADRRLRGHARTALQRIRQEFGTIVANGVEDDSAAEAFWIKMGAEGLVDRMIQYSKPPTDFDRQMPSTGP